MILSGDEALRLKSIVVEWHARNNSPRLDKVSRLRDRDFQGDFTLSSQHEDKD
jgi:hypothetical protein